MNFDYLKQEIDYRIGKLFDGKQGLNKIIYDAMCYSLNTGGKRVRPILFLYTYALFKNNYQELIPFACCIEMIHTYSLIHDDLPCMDNDMLRRGNLTNHIKFNEGIALLAGDGLLTEAFKDMIEFSIKNGENALYATYIIAKSIDCDGMIGGQAVDINTKGIDLDEETLNYINRSKTASLLKACVLSAAYMGGASEDEISKLSEYGYYVGMVFQIIDDVLDKTSDTITLGKSSKSDERNKKFTYADLYGIDRCREICEDLNERAINVLNSLGRDVSGLIDFTKFMLSRKF